MTNDTNVSHFTPTIGEAMHVTYKALRAYHQRLRRESAAPTHLRLQDIRDRLREMEPMIMRMRQQPPDEVRRMAWAVRRQLSSVARDLRALDPKLPRELDGRVERPLERKLTP